MDGNQVNAALSTGRINEPGLFPKLEVLEQSPFRFRVEFGLDELPAEPGVILIGGARQYGKSTWLQEQIRLAVGQFGPGSCFVLNGDELRDGRALIEAVRALIPLFSTTAAVRRLFIDEITAIGDWQAALKRLLDAGELKNVLVVTTGSKAADLRHGSERLPGRKGRLDRTAYLFTPVSYAEFKRVCGESLRNETLTAYLLSGGSPLACAELAARRRLPDYVIEITRDWIYGECAASGRSRSFGSAGHEVDFLCPPGTAIEVKVGRTSPMEFGWFPRCMPRATLSVVGRDRFGAGVIQGITLEDFLLAESTASL